MGVFQNLTTPERWKLLGITILLVGVGQLRIFVLENINYQLYHLYYSTEQSPMHNALSFLSSLSYDSLMLVKWFITISITVIVFLSSLWALNTVFQNKIYNRILVGAYVALVFVSFLLYAMNGLIGDPDSGYYAARYVMGIAQSPMPVLILLPFFTLANQK